jgi:hypothetical protein
VLAGAKQRRERLKAMLEQARQIEVLVIPMLN